MNDHPRYTRLRLISMLFLLACTLLIVTRLDRATTPTTAQEEEPLPLTFTQTGSIGGEIYITAIYEPPSGQAYACVGEGYGLTILDVQNPKSPTRVARLLLDGIINDIYIAGTYAYVADTDGLKVVDISNPASPNLVGQYITPGSANGVYVDGQYAYIADGAEGATCGHGCYLHIVDVSNPASIPTEPVSKVSYLESVYDVYVHDGYTYVTNGSRGIQIVGIGTPTSPQKKPPYDTTGSARSIEIVDTTAYLADGSGGMEIIDISTPEAPTPISTYDEIATANHVGIDAEKSLAYISAGSEGVKIVDISTPKAPTLKRTYATRGEARYVAVANGYAYVASDQDGLDMVDIQPVPLNPPEVVGRYSPPSKVNDIYAVGQYAYVAAGLQGLRVIDTSNPAMPKALGQYDTSGDATAVYIDGNYAYVADGSEGMQIINISTPYFPTIAGSYKPEVQIRDVYVKESYAYVAAWDNAGLHVVNISDLEKPTHEEDVDTGKAKSVYVAGDYAYVATAENGLQIVDISSPITPTLVGDGYDTTGTAEDVFVVGDYAYVAAAKDGLHIVDISEPTKPEQVSIYKPTDAKVMSVYVVGDYAFVADEGKGLLVLDVSDPTAPKLMSDNSYDTPGQANSMYVTRGVPNDLAYLADGVGGLHIVHLDTDQPPPPTPTNTPTPAPSNDDKCETAIHIANNGTEHPLTFEKKDDVDWVQFDAVANEAYMIEAYATENSPADIVVEFANSCDTLPKEPSETTFSRGVKFQLVAPTTGGTIFLKMANKIDQYDSSVTYTIAVRHLPPNTNDTKGALILVAGRLKNNDTLQPNIHHVTGNVYTVFKSHGYDDEHIYYLSTDTTLPGIDNGQATKDKLEEAITEWAPKYVDSDHPLTLYLMDHGSEEHGFYLDEITDQQRVSPSELAEWLEEIPSDVPINIIIEACNSGVFIQELAKEGRVIITSTKSDLLANTSDKGATFSDHFLDTLNGYSSLYKAFQDGSIAVKTHSIRQEPQIEGNGNGIPNELEDEQIAQQRSFGTKALSHNNIEPNQFRWPPSIVDVQSLLVENAKGTIRAYVIDDTGVDSVWATIYKPSFTPSETANEMVSEINLGLPRITLIPESQNSDDECGIWYSAEYTQFDEEEGIYRIVIHAKDEHDLEAQLKVIEYPPNITATETPTSTPTTETTTPISTPTTETTNTPTPIPGLQVYLPLVRR